MCLLLATPTILLGFLLPWAWGISSWLPQQSAATAPYHLGINELKWTGMGEFNSDDHYIYYCRQESLRRNGVAIMVNKRVRNAVLGCNLRNDRMISVRFQGKPFNITVIQVYAPTSNTEEAEVERFYEDLQDLLELTPKKDVLFIMVSVFLCVMFKNSFSVSLMILILFLRNIIFCISPLDLLFIWNQ